MSRNRFVVPEVDRLNLSDGDWIEVKGQLNNGEQKKLESVGLKPPIRSNGEVITPIDWETHEIERVLIFLVDWSFRDANGKPVPVSKEALKALDIDSFKEVNDAITTDVLAKVTKRKNE